MHFTVHLIILFHFLFISNGCEAGKKEHKLQSVLPSTLQHCTSEQFGISQYVWLWLDMIIDTNAT